MAKGVTAKALRERLGENTSPERLKAIIVAESPSDIDDRFTLEEKGKIRHYTSTLNIPRYSKLSHFLSSFFSTVGISSLPTDFFLILSSVFNITPEQLLFGASISLGLALISFGFIFSKIYRSSLVTNKKRFHSLQFDKIKRAVYKIKDRELYNQCKAKCKQDGPEKEDNTIPLLMALSTMTSLLFTCYSFAFAVFPQISTVFPTILVNRALLVSPLALGIALGVITVASLIVFLDERYINRVITKQKSQEAKTNYLNLKFQERYLDFTPEPQNQISIAQCAESPAEGLLCGDLTL